MDHPREIEWIELANGTADTGREAGLRDHLAECSACRSLFERIQQTHAALGAMDDLPEFRDLSDHVLAEANVPEPSVVIRLAPMAWRLAASVAIASAVGWAAGAAARPQTATGPQIVDEVDVTERLALPAMQVDSAAGLAELVFTMPVDDSTGEGASG